MQRRTQSGRPLALGLCAPRAAASLAGIALCLAALTGCPPSSEADADAAGTTDVADVDVADGAADADVAPELPDVECQSDAECQLDADTELPVCAVPRCLSGACVLGAADDGVACDDGNDCTTGDTCLNAVCEGGPGPDCDDGNACTTDACAPDSGCVHTFNQKPCDDGSACTVADSCFQGACKGTPLGCDDGNPCTDNLCDAATGCQWTDNSAACEDGDACTVGDTCVAGQCEAGAVRDCGEGNPCLDASCDALTGCIVDLVEGACDDANACTSDDTCIEGACVGDLVVCDDGNPCTSDYCDGILGCQAAANVLACDDGDPCTLKDQCMDSVCMPGFIDPLCCDDDGQCDDDDPCTLDTCDLGYCAFVPLDCDDGYECTADACVGGVCQNSPFGPVASGPVLEDSFEADGALAQWEITSTNADVTWRLDESKARTGARSLYCGKIPEYSYDFGVTDASARRDLQVPAGTATLELWIEQDLAESGSCNFDYTTVFIAGEEQTPCLGTSLTSWTRQAFDLSAWSGQVVELEVRFRTIDSAINDGGGVWIDDVVVLADNPAGCCLADTDCGGMGCEASTCGVESFICEPPDVDSLCDDGDPCTTDVCIEGGECASAPIVGCCNLDGDCPSDPEAPCAVPICEANSCGLDTSGCP